MRIGVKVFPGVYASTRVGSRRRKSRSRHLVWPVLGALAALGFAVEHAWVVFGVVLPMIGVCCCVFMAIKTSRRKK